MFYESFMQASMYFSTMNYQSLKVETFDIEIVQILEFVGYKFPKYVYLDLCSWNDGLFSNRFCEFSRQKAR